MACWGTQSCFYLEFGILPCVDLENVSEYFQPLKQVFADSLRQKGFQHFLPQILMYITIELPGRRD